MLIKNHVRQRRNSNTKSAFQVESLDRNQSLAKLENKTQNWKSLVILTILHQSPSQSIRNVQVPQGRGQAGWTPLQLPPKRRRWPGAALSAPGALAARSLRAAALKLAGTAGSGAGCRAGRSPARGWRGTTGSFFPETSHQRGSFFPLS